jgi:hypothetical protein
MTTINVHNTSDPWTSQSSNETSWLFRLPPEILQVISGFLNIKDINALSQTCRSFVTFFNNDGFWIHRIHQQFSHPVAQLYTYDVFQKPEIIQTYNEIRPSGFANIRTDAQIDICAITSATHYNDDAVEKRHLKMYVSEEDFLNNLQFYQFNKPNNYMEIPLMKLIYFYLIDRKRRAAVDMSVIHRNTHYLVEEDDVDSLKGRIIHLESVCWLEITGDFEHKIMPGKYEVSWRMKSDLDGITVWGETEFIVVPQHGRIINYKISENDFRDLHPEHGNHWFLVKMGQTIIYEPSSILVAIRNWSNGSWKGGLSWDCIELAIVP